MKTQAERGRHGRWLVAARTAKGYKTQTEARRELAKAGIKIAHSTYAGYEAGLPVSKNHMPLLVEFWGPPEDYETDTRAEPDQSALIAALHRQSTAIESLVMYLEGTVAEQGRRLDEVEAVLRTRFAPAMRDTTERPAREPTAGSK